MKPKRRDGHRALQIEIIYRARRSPRWFCTGKGSNWRQYRIGRHWHVKIVWPLKIKLPSVQPRAGDNLFT